MDDTIFALSTPAGTGGIAVIRITGKDAHAVLDRVFFPNVKKMRELCLGEIVFEGETLDRVMAVKFAFPRSYTGENMAEIHCHGGRVAQQCILGALRSVCDRPAQPGEFTRRAFLNGKMDLTEAESVMGYISAAGAAGAKNAMQQMRGALKERIDCISSRLLSVLSFIEAVIEYPEEDFDQPERQVDEELAAAEQEINCLLKTFDYGKVIKEGFKVAIAGKPNVGKSSLLNYITGEDKAIVTSSPGTTRDIIEATIQINGIAVKMMDTAGIRDACDEAEKIGVERAMKAAADADTVMYVIDASVGLDDEDRQTLNDMGAHVFVALNKMDERTAVTEEEIMEEMGRPVISVSAKTGYGMDRLFDFISAIAGKTSSEDGLIITNERHASALLKTAQHLNEALTSLKTGVPVDIISVDIRAALDSLYEITGANVTNEVIDQIFSKFCLGK